MMRFPPKKILVPTDLSPRSFAAFPLAADLAGRFWAKLDSVYVEPVAPIDTGMFYWKESMDPEYRNSVRDRVRRKMGYPCRHIFLMEGQPEAGILRLIDKEKPDLVVMGTHGRTGLRRLLVGSTTEYVVRRSTVPVLTVRHRANPIRSILAPVNFKTYSDVAFAYAAAVAAAVGARLSVFHAVSGPELSSDPRFSISGMLARLPEWIQKACQPEIVVKKCDPVKGILAQAKKCDLVVLAAHKKQALKDAFLGTTAEQVLRTCSVPVLTVPSPEAPISSVLRRRAASKI